MQSSTQRLMLFNGEQNAVDDLTASRSSAINAWRNIQRLVDDLGVGRYPRLLPLRERVVNPSRDDDPEPLARVGGVIGVESFQNHFAAVHHSLSSYIHPLRKGLNKNFAATPDRCV